MGYNRPAPQIPKQKEENKPPILPPKPNFNKTHSITNLVLDDTRTKLECCNPKKQQPALLNEMYELKISDTDKNKHIIVNLSTGSIKKPDGIYFFVNPVDKPKNIILGQLGVVQGHTSLTQGENGNLQPQRVYYAGETVFKEGSLEKWTNGSGHYKLAAKNYNTSMKDIPKELLPHNKFEEGHARDMKMVI